MGQGMKRRAAGLHLLLAALQGLCLGCAATKPTPTEDREAALELTMAPGTADIDPLVSGGEEDTEDRYPTTVLVESFAAPGFSGRPGSNGICSGVLIAKDLVLTAGHCLCMRPMHYFVNKSLNRSDCASRVQVKQYLHKDELSSDGDVEKTITTYPKIQGVAFLSEKFKVDLGEHGETRSISSDIAVIRLKNPINIKLDYEPAERQMLMNDRITVVGFGSLSVNGLNASRIRHYGWNTLMGTRLLEYKPKSPPDEQMPVGEVYYDSEANAEHGDSGGPCFREEPGHRRLVGIVLHKRPSTGVKTTCLDLFQYKDRLEKLIQQARSSTD